MLQTKESQYRWTSYPLLKTEKYFVAALTSAILKGRKDGKQDYMDPQAKNNIEVKHGGHGHLCKPKTAVVALGAFLRVVQNQQGSILELAGQ